jgi:hypothetical protein
MRTPLRVPRSLLVSLVAGLLFAACKGEDLAIVQALRNTWSVTDAEGQTELVTFAEETIRWRVGMEDEYECPYRLVSYHDGEGTVHLRLKSKKRTGSDDWIEYILTFSEDRRQFRMVHSEDVLDGVFVQSSS